MNERTRRLFSQFFYEDPAEFNLKKQQVLQQTSSQQDQDELPGNRNDKKLNEQIEEKKTLTFEDNPS